MQIPSFMWVWCLFVLSLVTASCQGVQGSDRERSPFRGDSPIRELTLDDSKAMANKFADAKPRAIEASITNEDLRAAVAVKVNFLVEWNSPVFSEAAANHRPVDDIFYSPTAESISYMLVNQPVNVIREIKTTRGRCGVGMECNALNPSFPSSFQTKDTRLDALQNDLKEVALLSRESVRTLPLCTEELGKQAYLERARYFFADNTYTDLWFVPTCRTDATSISLVNIDAVRWAQGIQVNERLKKVLTDIEGEWRSSSDYTARRENARKEMTEKCNQGSHEYCRCIGRKSQNQ